jgi:hypothetical protein
MKLKYFSIRDYRSIAKAELENLQSAAILIGPNNEGKSNVLQGLNACLSLLRAPDLRRVDGKIQLLYDRESYDWATDFPISKQLKRKSGESVFQLHFQLSESEKVAFQSATGSKLNSVLPIGLSFGPGRFAAFRVLKQGRGGVALTRKPAEICKFVASTLDFAYIPAVRTADASLEVVNGLVSRELRQLEQNPRYAELQKELEALQKPILDGIAGKLEDNLRSFLGTGLKDVSLALVERHRFQRFGKACQITIDDGTPTLLERKGDGVQSLVAISLMTGALQETGADKDIILLLEEPESHLHPNAIHQLRKVLDSLREDNQLIVTTHCPLLVNRANVPSNLIVSKNKASPAKSLADLREVLGVRTSDNLQHAALVIVVEGPEDEVALRALLNHYSQKLGDALANGGLTFQTLGGASKLPYALQMLQSSLCNYYAFLDDDEEGRKGYDEAAKSFLASPANTTFTKCLGLPEAEFEDLLNPNLYADFFQTHYAVDVGHRPFDEKQKWSKRIRFGLIKAGKNWPEKVEYDDKRAIADLVASTPATAIHPAREQVLKSFVSALETKLNSISAGKTA